MSLLEHALAAAARGWRIFPIDPGAKAGWHAEQRVIGSKSATADAQQIRSWWEREPLSNYGVACGVSRLYVVDLDVKGDADGVARWAELLAANGLSEINTFTVTTPSGGVHVYFRMPAGRELKNTQSVLGPGIDTRGVGGHVVGPGSLIGDRAYEVSVQASVLPLPGFVLRAIDAYEAEHDAVPAAGTGVAVEVGADLAARLDQLCVELTMAPNGQGNATAARVAFMVGQYVGAGQLGINEAVDRLVAALADWTWRSEDDARAMVHTLESQVAAGSRRPRAWDGVSELEIVFDASKVVEEISGAQNGAQSFPTDDGEDEGSFSVVIEAEDVVETIERPRGRDLHEWVLDWNDLHKLEAPVPLIEGVLDQGSIAVLAGKFGTYKSFLAIDWAAHVASGRAWNGFEVPEPSRVLYVAAEGAPGIRKRARAWSASHVEIEPGQFAVLHKAARLTNAVDAEELLRIVVERDVHLLVLDTLHRAIPGIDEQSSSEMGKVLDVLHKFIEVHPKLCVLLVHHTGHTGDRARGSSAIEDDVDATFVIKLGDDGKAEDRGPDTMRRLSHRKSKDGELFEERTIQLELIEGTDSGVLRAPADLIGQAGLIRIDDPVADVIAALDAAGAPLTMGRDAIQAWAHRMKLECTQRDAAEVAARRKARGPLSA